MIGPRTVLAAVVAAALLAIPLPRAGAQITGSIGATAVVTARPLAGTGVRNLQFGIVVPGTPAVVSPNSNEGGEYRLSGTKSRKSIDITFVLPVTLVGPGGTTIPLDFNANTAALCEVDTANTCVPASYYAWNPVTSPLYHDTPARYVAGRKVYAYDLYSVYIGGTATPAATQKPGTYTGAIGVVLVVN